MACSRPARVRSSRASCGAPLATGTRPICDVTMTRSPTTIGDDVPRPPIEARHASCSVVLQVVGRLPDPAVAPLPGPRHCGQSVEAAGAAETVVGGREACRS